MEENLHTIATYFRADILRAFVSRLGAKLESPANLNCVTRSGRSIDVPHIGGEEFRLSGVEVTDVMGSKTLRLRLTPVLVQEYLYATVLEKEADFFHWSFKQNRGNFKGIYETILCERDDKNAATYGDVYRAAIQFEKTKINKAQLSSHNEYGSW
jgi:hypothetical protein